MSPSSRSVLSSTELISPSSHRKTLSNEFAKGGAGRSVSNSRGSTSAVFLVCSIYPITCLSKGIRIEPANGANRADRKPPVCRTFLFLAVLTFFDANLRRCVLYLRSFVFCLGVNGTLPFNIFHAHSQRLHMRSLSECSRIAFRSLLFFCLCSNSRHNTCFFMRDDILLMTVQARCLFFSIFDYRLTYVSYSWFLCF